MATWMIIDYYTTPTGGTTIQELKAVGRSAATLVLGHSLTKAGEILTERFGTPATVFDQLTGLGAVDEFLYTLTQLSGRPVPAKYRAAAAAGAGCHAGYPFLLWAEEGCDRPRTRPALQHCLVAALHRGRHPGGSYPHQVPLLKNLPTEKAYIGDLEDFEELAAGADLLITNSKARPLARRLGIPLFLHGFPMLDHFGNNHRCTVGYRGTLECCSTSATC
jgi:nitrogenase molybdenum-iron protein alpha/beta subunit